MVRDVVGCFMNLCGKSQTESELKHYWSKMVMWIESMKIDKENSATLCRLAIEVTNDTKRKKGHFFNFYFKDCILNLEERTTGRTEVENRHLKVQGNDQRTSFTKLASTDKKRQNIRENNLQLQSCYTNRTTVPGELDDFSKFSNKLTAHAAKEHKTQFDWSAK